MTATSVEVTASQITVHSCALAGRCANGSERDGGTVVHAVPERRSTALCGAKPGRRSAGWGEPLPTGITCVRCYRKTNRGLVSASVLGTYVVRVSP